MMLAKSTQVLNSPSEGFIEIPIYIILQLYEPSWDNRKLPSNNVLSLFTKSCDVEYTKSWLL